MWLTTSWNIPLYYGFFNSLLISYLLSGKSSLPATLLPLEIKCNSCCLCSQTLTSLLLPPEPPLHTKFVYVCNLICLPVHLSSSLHNRLGCHCLLQYQNLASLKLNSLVPTTMPCTNPSFFIFVNNIMIQSLAQAQIWEIIFYCTFWYPKLNCS